MPTTDVANLREDYQKGTLSKQDLLADPIAQFRLWIEEAIADNLPEPNAVIVATVDALGQPNARVVLLKGFDTKGFVFYTNYESAKATELSANSGAAMVFNWLAHERQVRVRGRVEQVSREETATYFHSRPRSSQLGAWASPQSRTIESRDVVEALAEEVRSKFADVEEIPVPSFWGGYRVVPSEIEFWQGRASRLHDRFRYQLQTNGWRIDRLAP